MTINSFKTHTASIINTLIQLKVEESEYVIISQTLSTTSKEKSLAKVSVEKTTYWLKTGK